MKPARLLEACERLERVAAARLRAVASELRYLEAEDARSKAQTLGVKTALLDEPQWTAGTCASVDLRAQRAALRNHKSLERVAVLRRAARIGEEERRHWARLARGLARRVARQRHDLRADLRWLD